MKVSIITAFYKGNQYVPNLLNMMQNAIVDSKSKKVECELEYILVNDSPEENIDLEYFHTKEFDFKLKTICNPRNLGIHQTRVNGLQASTGDYVTFLDQDDCIESTYLSSQVMCINNNHQPDVVVANGWRQKDDLKRVIYKDVLKQRLVTKKWPFIKAANQIISPGQVLIKRNSIPEEWSKHILHTNGSDDMMLWLMMKDRNAGFVINSEKLYIHRDMDTSISNEILHMNNSSMSVLDIFKKHRLVSPKVEKGYLRRLTFVNEVHHKNGINKLLIYLKYFDVVVFKAIAHFM